MRNCFRMAGKCGELCMIVSEWEEIVTSCWHVTNHVDRLHSVVCTYLYVIVILYL